MQRHTAGGGTHPSSPSASVPGVVTAAARAPGFPLPSGVREPLEAGFAAEFGSIASAVGTAPGGVSMSRPGDVSELQADRVGARVASRAPSSPARRGEAPDLSQVRVHTGALAGRAARSVSASAYTLGTDIVFADGAYAPETPRGRALLTHELTHVLQQRKAGTRSSANVARQAREAGPGAGSAEAASRNVAALGNDALKEEYEVVRGRVLQPRSYPTRQADEQHLQELEREVRFRGIAVEAPSGGAAPRAGGPRVVRGVRFVAPSFFGSTLELGETTLVQTRPDPSAGWNFDTWLLDEMHGRRIPAQHLGGTRYRVLMGTPECPGCHFGNGLQVDLHGQNFALVLLPMMASGAMSISSARGFAGAAAAEAAPVSAASRVASPPSLSVIRGGGATGRAGGTIPMAPQPAAAASPRAFSGNAALKIEPAQVPSPQVTPRPLQAVPAPPPAPAALAPTTATGAGTGLTSGLAPGTAAAVALAGVQSGKQTGAPSAYPLLWPTILPIPPRSTFVRTPGADRDENLANEVNAYKWFRARDEDLRGQSLVGHHVIPLMLGGTDTRDNIILWNTESHRRGHPCLNDQPQMLTPPPPLAPLPRNLLGHPAGTRYVLTGFKDCP